MVSSLATQIIIISIVFTVLPILAVAFRFWSRFIKRSGFSWDDYFILPGLLFSVAICINTIIAVTLGGLGSHIRLDAEGNIVLDQRLIIFLQTEFATQLLSVLSLVCTKLSIVLFYRRIFRGKAFSIASLILLVLISGWGISFFFATLLECIPIPQVWKTLYGTPEHDKYCYQYVSMFKATAISNMIVDVAILSVPIPIVWNLKVSTKQKLAISGIFLLGAFVVGISIARIYFFYQSSASYEDTLDITVNIAPTLYWTELEASIAVISACLPTLKPLFSHLGPILVEFASKFTLASATKSFERLPRGAGDLDRDSLKGSRSSDVGLVNRCEAIHMQNIDEPLGKEASFAEIAAATGLDQGLVRRFIRHAIVKDIFVEPRPGIVAHNAVSRLLAEDQVVHDWVGASTDDLWQAAAQTCNALDKWSASQEPNETASIPYLCACMHDGFALANKTDQSIYLEFSKFPERARRFGNAMRAFTEGTGFELSHIVNNFPWGDLGEGIIVGGSQGFASFAIARQFPQVSCVVQDLEPVIAAVKNDTPPDLASRVKFMTHDFFTEQPVVGADVYFFRWIFHNWSDKYAVEILRKHIPALKKGAKIVINDNILPQPGMLSQWQEDRLRSMDLTMTEIQSSYEREVDDWAKLFRDASPRFAFQGAKQPYGSNLGFMVAEWQGESE
ncbi:hypothetical protein GQX73_g4493 [Xylaria multiplex]|uniref:Uncharacterized protein n=1 Tax=Xylaria multiplex TaxID=323545 RepID=A0A7C8IU18_9PEZI|nr:hypothetical protein GQX73_g4493 [Xylaria multiplex]